MLLNWIFFLGIRDWVILSPDFFSDGRFYLLAAPGHTHDHICGFARTSKDEFFFLGGDIAHHACEFRLTTYLPLPAEINPSPFDLPSPHQSVLVLSSRAFIVLQTRASIERLHFTPSTWAANVSVPETKLALTKWNVSVRRCTSLSLLHILPAFWAYCLSFLGQLPLGIVRMRKSSAGGDFLRDFEKAVQPNEG